MTAAPNPEGGPVMGCDDSGPTPVTLVDGGKVGEVKKMNPTSCDRKRL